MEGDLVWLVGDTDQRGHYNLGQISQTISGVDGVVQFATVQTKDGTYK